MDCNLVVVCHAAKTSMLTLPILAILAVASFKVPSSPMQEDSKEKDWIVERDRGNEASTDRPSEGLDKVGSIIWLSSVFPPSINEKLVSLFRLNELGVLDYSSGEAREGLSDPCVAVLLHLEARLLAHGGVEDVVGGKQCSVEQNVSPQWEAVHLGVVSSHEDDRVGVREWHASQVPEGKEPSEKTEFSLLTRTVSVAMLGLTRTVSKNIV